VSIRVGRLRAVKGQSRSCFSVTSGMSSKGSGGTHEGDCVQCLTFLKSANLEAAKRVAAWEIEIDLLEEQSSEDRVGGDLSK
jgi:hypothetical protein